jgi:hypothetical protein
MMPWEQAELIGYNQIREHEEMELVGLMATGKWIK